MNNDKKKVLFICSNHFPVDGANGKMVKILIDNGLSENFDIHVLTHKYDLNDLDEERINNYYVHRFMSWYMFPKNTIISYIKSNYKLGYYSKLLFKKVLPKLYSRIDKKHFLSNQYIDDLYENIKSLHNKYHFDVLVPVVDGFETAEAALKFHNDNHDVPFILYQLDPCADNDTAERDSIPARKNLEIRCLNNANAIITTPIITEFYKKNYPVELTNKVVSMEFPNVVPVEQNYKYDPDKIICLFAGNIYRGIRNPDYTLKLFGALEDTNIELHILGSCDEPIKEELLKKNIKFFDSVSSKEAEGAIRSANILVNIGNSMTNQVPSKIFEYISTGKPIINIYKNENCPTLPYFEKYEYVCNILEKTKLDEKDVESMKSFIEENYLKYENTEKIVKDFEECTASKCVQEFNVCLEQCLENGEAD